MTQEQLERDGIKVGDYYVVRRGKRIAVFAPETSDPEWNDALYRYEWVTQPPSLVVSFTEKQAKHLFDAPKRLAEKQKELDAIPDKIEALRGKIYELEGEIADLEEKLDESGGVAVEKFDNYEVTSDCESITFGCTEVDKKTLAKIKKLL